MRRKLNVFLQKELVGKLAQDSEGRLLFSYTHEYLEKLHAYPISYSMPIREEPYKGRVCHAFFGGILPEADKRELIAKHFGVSARNDFALLEKIGGECAGAITLLPEENELSEETSGYQQLTLTELHRVLKDLPKRPLLAGVEGIRLSLAGVQDKIPVKIEENNIFLPLGNAPSTHILKPAIDRFAELTLNEAFCLKLAAKLHLSVANVSVHAIEEIDYLLIERYDRKKTEKDIQRLHQEDFCQALGIPSELKYQNEGGPSLKQCFHLLRKISSAPVLDLKMLLDAVIFNFMIGNHDAHAKNFSLLYEPNYARLAPLYDLVSTVYYPELTLNMAMKIGSKYKSQEVSRHDFERMAEEVGLAKPMVIERVAELLQNTRGVLDELQEQNPTFLALGKLISKRIERLKKLF